MINANSTKNTHKQEVMQSIGCFLMLLGAVIIRIIVIRNGLTAITTTIQHDLSFMNSHNRRDTPDTYP